MESRCLRRRCRGRPDGWWLLAALAVLGCDSRPTGTITGKVTFQGQPVTAGHVTFLGQDGRVASGQITDDATYTIYGAPVGAVKILVDSRPPPNIVLKEPPKSVRNLKLPGAEDPEVTVTPPRVGKYVPIPERYSRSDQSELTYTVRKGAHTHDLVLVP